VEWGPRTARTRERLIKRYADNLIYADATLGQRKLAFWIAAAAFILTLVVAPFARKATFAMGSFVPTLGAIEVFAELLTAFLLLNQFRASHHTPLAVLALAYAQGAVFNVLYLLTLPRVFSEHGLFDAGQQTAPWFYLNARLMFLLLIIAFAVWEHLAQWVPKATQQRTLFTLSLGFSIYSILTFIYATTFHNALPALTAGSVLTPLWQRILGPFLISVALAGLAGLYSVTGLRRVVHVWVSVALVAILCEFVTASVLSHARFTYGWYFSRGLWLLASTTLLFALLHTINDVLLRLTSSDLKMQELSITDQLTGLLNRGGFDERLKEDARWAQRRSETLSVLIVDIDDFKRYNDHFGLGAGDGTLISIARVVRSMLGRPEDSGSRIGDDEFAVLLPDTTEAGAMAVAERIRRNVERLAVVQGPGARHPFVTTSIGIASSEHHNECEPKELMRRADAALYGAKAAGRNCIRMQGAIYGEGGETYLAG
jgi:diguanylate cyclase (GGDEF)-like protein